MHLLRLEWQKWNKNIVFRVLMIFYIVSLPSLLLLGKRIKELPPPIGTTEVLFMFPTVWEYLGYIGNWLTFFFMGFFAVLMITLEYSNRTLRQNIINGLTRVAFYKAKIYFVLAISLLATLYYAACALVIGYFNTDIVTTAKVFQNWAYIPRYFLMCSGYMIFGVFLGFLIKRTGITLFIYMSYIMFIELILRWGVHANISRHKSMHYYPMNGLEDLVPIPYTQQAEQFLSEFGFDLFLSPTEAVITSLFYLTIFLMVGYQFIRRADL